MAAPPNGSTGTTTRRSPTRSAARRRATARASSPAARRSLSARRPRLAPPPRTALRSARPRSPARATDSPGTSRPSSFQDIRAEWRQAGARGEPLRRAWEGRLQSLVPERRGEFLRRQRGDLPTGLDQAIAKVCAEFREKNAKIATRQASGIVLDSLTHVVPELVGGSADLTPSNNTKAKDQKDVRPGDYSGHYIRYGVREHGMAAAMNGIALHGGLVPYGGTFLTFSDYARPSIRLAAFMGVRVIYVMTHDSIGLGEDGPTHQPVEHLAALRAMPGLNVYRPADPVETAECWALALQRRDGPSLLALTRQSLPLLRPESGRENRSALGAYVLAEAEGMRQVTLLATGSEVSVAIAAREMLAKRESAQLLCRCPVGSCSTSYPKTTRRRCWARRHALPSRPPLNSAGSAGSDRAVRLSA